MTNYTLWSKSWISKNILLQGTMSDLIYASLLRVIPLKNPCNSVLLVVPICNMWYGNQLRQI